MDKLSNEIASIKMNIKNASNEDSKQDEINDKYNNNTQLREFENWILTVFGNNGQIGKEYVELIVNKEGFDNLQEFIQLTENDLKEIGIDKKGHRLKFMTKMKQYRENEKNASQLVDTEGS